MSLYKGSTCVAGAGRSSIISIRPSDNHWLIDGVDTGITATAKDIKLDNTLTMSDCAANAKSVGDAIKDAQDEMNKNINDTQEEIVNIIDKLKNDTQQSIETVNTNFSSSIQTLENSTDDKINKLNEDISSSVNQLQENMDKIGFTVSNGNLCVVYGEDN